MRPYLPLLLLACLAVLSGCSDAMETAKSARLPMDETVTLSEALARYPYFKSVAWSSHTDKDGKRIAEAVCEVDVPASCRDMNPAALAVARRDVARDYFVLRFVVAGFPRKVVPLEGQHVTQCGNGKRLALSDPKFLQAVYNREQVRFFCLEGLNCTGFGESAPSGDAPPAGSPAPPAQ